MRAGAWLAATAACLTAGCAANLETTRHCPPESVPNALVAPTIRVQTLNMAHARRSAANQLLVSKKGTYANLDAIAQFARTIDADVVALQEADGPSRWSGNFDHVAYLRNEADYGCSFLGHHADTWLYSFGAALMTQAAFRDSRSVRFPATPPTTTKGFVRVTLDWDVGGVVIPLTVVSVHLDFSRKSARDEQAAILVADLGELTTPMIIMGDLNSEWHEERSHVRQLAEALDLTAFEPEADDLATYGDDKRLDWILISRELRFVEHRVISDPVSDHQPVSATIAYRGTEEE